MIDTLKIILLPREVHYDWDIEEVKSKLQTNKKHDRKGYKPLGYIKNISVSGNNNILIIEGSIPKYYMGNNVENFNWLDVEPAIENLSEELELPLRDGRICRVDVGANIALDYVVAEYLKELGFLELYQRIDRHKTTLRYEKNSLRHNMLFYDKLVENKKYKLIDDISLRHFTKAQHLMRAEYQFQERLSQTFKMPQLRVSNLYTQEFCKELMRHWYTTYQSIHKNAILRYPKSLKGNLDFEKFIKRLIVQLIGWKRLNDLMKSAVKQGSLSPSDKSKKLKQFREVMLDNYSFEFEENILELNEKIKLVYVKSLMQIYKLNKISAN